MQKRPVMLEIFESAWTIQTLVIFRFGISKSFIMHIESKETLQMRYFIRE